MDERALETGSTEGACAGAKPKSRRIPVLDGWRAVSILFVLAAHLMPLGPKSMQLNFVAGAMGMALFFTLSGFLIVQFLAGGAPLPLFVLKRLARIVPLSWVAMAVLALWHHYDAETLARNFLFVANLPPAALLIGGQHLWSLCVEMQFDLGVTVICLLFGRRGLYLVPLPRWLEKGLASRPMAYIAEISYALYVIHGVLSATWLGSGARLVKYSKRPLLLAATFGLAHLSTRYFEQPITRQVRRLREVPKNRRPRYAPAVARGQE